MDLAKYICSEVTHLPGMLLPWDLHLEYWTELVTMKPMVSKFHSQLGYSTGVLQALIVLVVFGAVDYPPASCMLVHLLETLILNDSWSVSLI